MSLGSGGWSRALEPALHLIMIDQAGLLHDRFARGEDGKVRNAADVEARRELRMTFRVYLYYYCFPGHVFGSLCDFGPPSCMGRTTQPKNQPAPERELRA